LTNAFAFLASDESSYVVGTLRLAAGGITQSFTPEYEQSSYLRWCLPHEGRFTRMGIDSLSGYRRG
jgi:hypothetical protein